jgi:hypothetical protein
MAQNLTYKLEGILRELGEIHCLYLGSPDKGADIIGMPVIINNSWNTLFLSNNFSLDFADWIAYLPAMAVRCILKSPEIEETVCKDNKVYTPVYTLKEATEIPDFPLNKVNLVIYEATHFKTMGIAPIIYGKGKGQLLPDYVITRATNLADFSDIRYEITEVHKDVVILKYK